MEDKSASAGSCSGGTSAIVDAVDGAKAERVGEMVVVGRVNKVGARISICDRTGLDGYGDHFNRV